jgi:hypothetical protein
VAGAHHPFSSADCLLALLGPPEAVAAYLGFARIETQAILRDHSTSCSPFGLIFMQFAEMMSKLKEASACWRAASLPAQAVSVQPPENLPWLT